MGLHILRKRKDGYHDLDTVFYPITLQDALEFVPSKTGHFQTYGKAVEGSSDNNLVLKAYHLLKQFHPSLPSLDIHLYKKIPMGAGLGGGSSDAAFMLMMMNKYFQLGISKQDLLNYALQLGSDCPFFIENTPCLASGRGEQLSPASVDLRKYFILLVKPSFHISTALAFAKITPKEDRPLLRQIIEQPITEWKHQLKNDFEDSLFPNLPELALIKQTLYDQGAVYASLSGSGSTVFGIFERAVSLDFGTGTEVYLLPPEQAL